MLINIGNEHVGDPKNFMDPKGEDGSELTKEQCKLIMKSQFLKKPRNHRVLEDQSHKEATGRSHQTQWTEVPQFCVAHSGHSWAVAFHGLGARSGLREICMGNFSEKGEAKIKIKIIDIV